MQRLAVLFVLTLAACNQDRSESHNETSRELQACVVKAGDSFFLSETEYREGQPLDVVLRYRGCLSGSCSGDYAGECTVTRDGNTLTVVGEVSWTEKTGFALSCTSDCRAPSGTCQTDALPAGTYNVVLGDQTATFLVGSSTSAVVCTP